MEIWKEIPEFNNEYEISTRGRMRSLHAVLIRSNGRKHTRESKILKPDTKYCGYAKGSVSVNKKLIPYAIHRLVAKAFIPNPENKPTVNHLDRDKSNNNVWNLEWATHKEQIEHYHNTGDTYFLKGSEVGNSILKEKDVLEIRRDFKPRVITRKMLANKYGVTEYTIKDVLAGRSWKHLL